MAFSALFALLRSGRGGKQGCEQRPTETGGSFLHQRRSLHHRLELGAPEARAAKGLTPSSAKQGEPTARNVSFRDEESHLQNRCIINDALMTSCITIGIHN